MRRTRYNLPGMLWVGQFGIAAGEAQEHSPWVGAFPDPRPGDDPIDLYLVVERALPGSEEFCAELTEAIASVFHQRKASLTGGLLRALKAAHEHLSDWNRKSLRDHRVAAGVSCLALRPRPEGGPAAYEGYLAQVAPASAVLYHGGAVLPLEPSLPDAMEPLGLHEEFWPDFRRLDLDEGDRLLLLSPELARALCSLQRAVLRLLLVSPARARLGAACSSSASRPPVMRRPPPSSRTAAASSPTSSPPRWSCTPATAASCPSSPPGSTSKR